MPEHHQQERRRPESRLNPGGAPRLNPGGNAPGLNPDSPRDLQRGQFPGYRERMDPNSTAFGGYRDRLNPETSDSFAGYRERVGEGDEERQQRRSVFDIESDEELAEQQHLASRAGFLEEHLREDPSDHKGFGMLAESYDRMGRPDMARRARENELEALRSQVRTDPENPEILNRMAEVFDTLGERESANQFRSMARNAFDRRMETDPFPASGRTTGLEREKEPGERHPSAVFN